jgi:hypothetical protein
MVVGVDDVVDIVLDVTVFEVFGVTAVTFAGLSAGWISYTPAATATRAIKPSRIHVFRFDRGKRNAPTA